MVKFRPVAVKDFREEKVSTFCLATAAEMNAAVPFKLREMSAEVFRCHLSEFSVELATEMGRLCGNVFSFLKRCAFSF